MLIVSTFNIWKKFNVVKWPSVIFFLKNKINWSFETVDFPKVRFKNNNKALGEFKHVRLPK